MNDRSLGCFERAFNFGAVRDEMKDNKEQRKERIKEAALKLFAEKGYASASMRDIARKGNIALGLAYNYYESKEALLLSIVNEGVSDMKKVLRPIESKAAFIAMVEDFFRLMKDKRAYWRCFIQIMLQGGLSKKAFQRVSDVFGKFFRLMADGFREYSDIPEDMASPLLHGIIFEHIMASDDARLEENKKMILGRL